MPCHADNLRAGRWTMMSRIRTHAYAISFVKLEEICFMKNRNNKQGDQANINDTRIHNSKTTILLNALAINVVRAE